MGRLDWISENDDVITKRRNVLVGSSYVIFGVAAFGPISGDPENDTTNEEDIDDDTEPDIVFEDEWFGPITEEPNPETFDPEDDWPTVEEWIDDVVEHLEFVFFEMDFWSVDAWQDAAEVAREHDNRFFEEIDPMFYRELDDGYVSDGIPAWDVELASIIDGPDESLTYALINIMNTAVDAENDGEVSEWWIRDNSEIIATVFEELDEHDRYDYNAPD